MILIAQLFISDAIIVEGSGEPAQSGTRLLWAAVAALGVLLLLIAPIAELRSNIWRLTVVQKRSGGPSPPLMIRARLETASSGRDARVCRWTIGTARVVGVRGCFGRRASDVSRAARAESLLYRHLRWRCFELPRPTLRCVCRSPSTGSRLGSSPFRFPAYTPGSSAQRPGRAGV